jgi:succinate dehydrogenase / fumarate reductase flavoprotein subunit
MEIYRDLGNTMWEHVGMARDEKGLKQAIAKISKLRDEFWAGFNLTGGDEVGAGEYNKYLELAGRVADFLELGELMARDALERSESCGGHFRLESQTPEGEALRDDDRYSYVAAWEYKGRGQAPAVHKEKLEFENVHLAQRSYK